LRDGRVTEWSFAYDVVREKRAADGANELLELSIWEAGPTLKGANSETGTLAIVKSANMTMTNANANIAGEMPQPSRLRAHLLAWHGRRASGLAGRTAGELSAVHAVEHAVPSVGDHAGGFLQRRLGLIDQMRGAAGGLAYLRAARVQRCGAGRVGIGEAPPATNEPGAV
jgi:hypothetical protein